MAIVDHALTTRAKVKEYAGITGTDQDAVIDSLINAYTAVIEKYCGGRRFKSTTYTEVYDTLRADKVFLNQRPCTAITLVELRGGTISTPTWTTFSADSYMKYLGAGYIQFFGKLSVLLQAFRITYTAGYLIDWTNELTATHTLPMDLTLACTELVAKRLTLRKSDGIASESTEGQSITYDSTGKDISGEIKTVLDSYKYLRVSA